MKCFLMQELTIDLRQMKRKMQRSWWSKQVKPKVLLEWTGDVHFCTICEITVMVDVDENLIWSLKRPLRNGCNCLYEPWSDFLTPRKRERVV